MITTKKKPYAKKAVEDILHPDVKRWFFQRFEDFSLPQRYAVVDIHSRKNVLVSAPTGATKTLTGFLSILNELVDSAQKGILQDRVYCIYISPLKALNYDIEVNLLSPLQEIEEIAGRKLGIRVAVRTGDTTAAEKQKMLKNPPHILITTPESLAILLTSVKFRETMRNVEWAIIDEIHALAENKRGVHLALSMERLQRLSPGLCRIGLSATVAPIEEVARFLVGYKSGEGGLAGTRKKSGGKNKKATAEAGQQYAGKIMDKESGMAEEASHTGTDDGTRDCEIIDVQFIKELDLKVMSPVRNLIAASHSQRQQALHSLLHELIQKHKTTLIFTNTRAATERVVSQLRELYPKHYGENIGAHHGSLSKEFRHSLEQRLREGKLKVVVSSTSLELGIDIGYIDLVVLLGSPKSVARALQRTGRSGHRLHATTKGRIIVLDRDDLVECSVLLKNAVEKKIDRIHIPTNCLDVLAQQIYGIAIEEGQISIKELLDTVRKSYCYHRLGRDDFSAVIDYLAGKHSALEKRHVYAKIWHDEENGMIGKRGKMARVIYMTNIGTIPDEAFVTVKVGQQPIGMIDESFLERLRRGDVFVLGGDKYEFLYSKGTVAFVNASVYRPPSIPHWVSEMLPLSFDLANDIGRFRRLLDEKLSAKKTKAEMTAFINSYVHVDDNAANSIYEYVKEQHLYSAIASDRKIVVEHYNDGKKYMYIFHCLFGRRVNDALSRAFAYALSRIHLRDIEMNISDNGFYLAAEKPINIEAAIKTLTSSDLYALLDLAIEKTEVLSRRFRHCAGRSLMILRSYRGKAKKVGRQQVSSQMLINAARGISHDFPILKEARREVLEDLMDRINALEVVGRIRDGRISIEHICSDIPSPFAFNLVLQGHIDILRIEDKHEFLKRMHQMVLAKIALDRRNDKKKESAQFIEELRDNDELGESFSYEQLWTTEENRRKGLVCDFEIEGAKEDFGPGNKGNGDDDTQDSGTDGDDDSAAKTADADMASQKDETDKPKKAARPKKKKIKNVG